MDSRIRLSRRQERRGAERFGGTVNPGSGNQGTHKNDMRTDTESVEFKGTRYRSFRLQLEELKTAYRHALLADKRMVFGIEFLNTVVGNDRYVILAEDDYLEMKQQLQELRATLEDDREFERNRAPDRGGF